MNHVWIVVDLGFGDAGKGTITDFLTRDTGARLVVRFNGGAQAGHNVVTEDGRHHTFAQFGAGTFVPDTRTHLAETVVIHPSALLIEAQHLERASIDAPLERLTIAEGARVITPFHQAANRIRELARRRARHGTCGVGVGETVRDALEYPEDTIYARDLRDSQVLWSKVERARDRLVAALDDEIFIIGQNHSEVSIFKDWDASERWIDFIQPIANNVVPNDWLTHYFQNNTTDVVFEGAQGVLLDENFGFHPHTTWSDCTFRSALALLRENGFTGNVTRLGVLRTYMTRHGEGPFPTENPVLNEKLPELHNASAGWQGAFRVGESDFVLTRYAVQASGGVDALALTHCDRIDVVDRVCTAYEMDRNEKLFDHDEQGRIMNLRAGDLEHQETLGEALREVRPVWTKAPETLDERIEQLEAGMGIPVRITSSGMTAADKKWRR